MKEPNDEEFVQAWIDAVKNKTGLKALAKKLDMEYQQVSIRASHLRRAKVGLPSMPHPNQKRTQSEVDTEKLNKMITDELGQRALGWNARR